MKTGSPSAMRQMNRNIIYAEFFRHGQLSRADLCRLTNLKPPTVSAIIQQLCEDGWLISCGKGDASSGGGPQPILYRINTSGYLFAGLDLCQSGITATLLDSELGVIHEQHFPLENRDLASLLETITDEFSAIAAEQNAVIKTLGISASGMVDHENGRINLSTVSQLDGFSFTSFFQEKLHLTPYVDNDINILLANAIHNTPALEHSSSILCFGIRRYGVGMSFAANRELYRGYHNLSGNILLFPERRDIADIVNQIVSDIPQWSDLSEDARFAALQKALQTGDREILNAVHKALESMCRCIAALQSVFDAQTIAIGCKLFEEQEALFQFMVEKCISTFSQPYKKTNFLRLPSSDRIFARSAAQCAFRHAYTLK